MSASPAWKLWEEEVADALGADIVKASGVTPLHKGDAKTSRFLVDAKHTYGHAYTLLAETWEKVQEWATNETKEPVVAAFVDGRRTKYRAVVVNEYLACELTGAEEYVPVTANRTSRTLVAMEPGDDPVGFELAGRRLVQIPFDDFVEMAGE